MAVYKLYSEQRIGVFVDVQNFYYSAKQLYNAKVNFAHILKDAIKGRRLIRALAYVIKADVGAERTFFDALDLMGYEVRSKDIQIFVGGAKKGDWDVGITMDCIALAQKLDVVVLCSGDGDFLPLVDYLQKSAGCRVEVMAFGRTTNKQLKEQADTFFDLCNSRYLIDHAGPRQRGEGGSDRKAPPRQRKEGPSRSDHSMPRYRNLESGHDRRDRKPYRRSHSPQRSQPHQRIQQPPRFQGGKDVSLEPLRKTESQEQAKKLLKKGVKKTAQKKKTTAKKKTAKKTAAKKTAKKKTTKKTEEK